MYTLSSSGLTSEQLNEILQELRPCLFSAGQYELVFAVILMIFMSTRSLKLKKTDCVTGGKGLFRSQLDAGVSQPFWLPPKKIDRDRCR